MKWLVWTGVFIVAVLFVAALVGGSGSTEGSVRQVIEETAKAVEVGLNSRTLAGVEPFFATPAEGANEAGLKETRDALRAFAASMSSTDQVQFHSFKVQSVDVHPSAGLARVTYRLHFSVVRGSQLAFGAVVIQDVALTRTPRGWRISGGDQPQLSDVKGRWSIR